MMNQAKSKSFYDQVYQEPRYAHVVAGRRHFASDELESFIRDYRLHEKRCLEVGCGRGNFQDLVEDYTGVDLSDSVGEFLHKPFHQGEAEHLPFDANSFDVIWSITVLEHVSRPEQALEEMRRVLRPGGLLFLKPAWHCRPWRCEGIPIRPYSELSWRQRWIKATLPIRESLLVRAGLALPKRFIALLRTALRPGPAPLRYGRLNPDYERFWMADSDAACALDPFDVILWFQARGDEIVSHPSLKAAILSRNGSLIVRIRKDEAAFGGD